MTDEQNNVSLHPARRDNLFVLHVLLFVASTSYLQPIGVNSTGNTAIIRWLIIVFNFGAAMWEALKELDCVSAKVFELRSHVINMCLTSLLYRPSMILFFSACNSAFLTMKNLIVWVWMFLYKLFSF
jgi:hypothetical protein